ncbi:hypothetical protein GE09DRAFT_1226294 [Coniochaeta sp. 2T2.1]|nr:hypothetical protein GE09DRAFT_1226294 [Coniochaeta sp. 2T2.1]
MKYLPHLVSLLTTSTHLTRALPPPPTTRVTRPFQIDGFVAQGYPQAMDGDKHLSFVEYNITLQAGEGNAWCWAWADVPDLSIGDIPLDTPCQADSTIKWSFVQAADGSGKFNFTVSWQYTGHGRLVGNYLVPKEQVQWVTDTQGNPVQDYVGPTSFVVDTVDVFGSS